MEGPARPQPAGGREPRRGRGPRRVVVGAVGGRTEEHTAVGIPEEDTPGVGTPVVEGTLEEDTLVEDKRPLGILQEDNLEEEEHQQGAGSDCSNS